MDHDAYAARMLHYYSRRLDPNTDKPGREYAKEWDECYATEGHHLRELAQECERVFAGRDVLEVAAGMGRWTRFILRTANSILATDASPRALDRLVDGATSGLDLPPGKFGAMKLDAFHPELAPGEFTSALVANWLQHMPRQILPDWLARLHSKLRPASVVMIAINHLSPQSRARLFSKPNDPNLYEPRTTFDGEPVDVIDNVFSEPDLRELLSPFARTFRFECGIGYYWVVYELS